MKPNKNTLLEINNLNISIAQNQSSKSLVKNISFHIKKNEIVLLKGKQIDEVDMGILASLGKTEVLVYSKPIVGFLVFAKLYIVFVKSYSRNLSLPRSKNGITVVSSTELLITAPK